MENGSAPLAGGLGWRGRLTWFRHPFNDPAQPISWLPENGNPEACMLPAYVTGDRFVLESVSRRAAHAVRLNGDAMLCRVLGKYLMVADVEDYTVAPHVALDGFWEPWTTLAIARAVRPGDHAIDVGANHGYFTLLLAVGAGPDGRVLAVEPNPRLARLAERTLELNGLTRTAEVRACAAGDGSQTRVRLTIPPHHGADASLCRIPDQSDSVLETQSVTVDELTRAWPRVDFIKIDAEGSEPAVWDGMASTLARNPRITVVLEFKPQSYSDAPGLLSAIRACGFPLRSIGPDGGLRDVENADVLRDGECMLFLRRAGPA